MTDDIKENKTHRRGWWRSMYYYMGWRYDSNNDKPSERDIYLKGVCMMQVSLSKIKLKETKTKPRIPYDLIKIKPIRPHTPYPKNHIEKSLKQKQHQKKYKSKLEILRSL
jgi:hypothetical protein